MKLNNIGNFLDLIWQLIMKIDPYTQYDVPKDHTRNINTQNGNININFKKEQQ